MPEPVCSAQAAAEHSVGRLDEFATQAVSNVLWGFSTLDFYHDEFFEAACAHIKSAALTGPRQQGACAQQTALALLMPRVCAVTREMHASSPDATLVACDRSAVLCAAMHVVVMAGPSPRIDAERLVLVQRTAAPTTSRRCPTACCRSPSWSLLTWTPWRCVIMV